MKFLAVLISVFAVAFGQRPWYAGSKPIGYPDLGNRFKEEIEPGPPTDNRFKPSNQPIPVDALGDVDLVNRLNQWDREHQPFWLLNAQHIEAHRNPQGYYPQQQLQPRPNLYDRYNDRTGYYYNYYPVHVYETWKYDDFGNPLY